MFFSLFNSFWHSRSMQLKYYNSTYILSIHTLFNYYYYYYYYLNLLLSKKQKKNKKKRKKENKWNVYCYIKTEYKYYFIF